jgi:hypothetical protein
LTADQRLSELRALRNAGVRSVALRADGSVARAEFFEVSEQERAQLAIEALDARERAQLMEMSPDSAKQYLHRKREALLYGGST